MQTYLFGLTLTVWRESVKFIPHVSTSWPLFTLQHNAERVHSEDSRGIWYLWLFQTYKNTFYVTGESGGL